MIGRREFITLLGGAASAWMLPAQAQQLQLRSIGALVTANPEPFWSEFRAGLRAHGYTEGQNIAFEFRSAGGKLALFRDLAGELVRLKVDVLVAFSTPAVTAARQATTEIPIVMYAGDPVGTGLISSLARPPSRATLAMRRGPKPGTRAASKSASEPPVEGAYYWEQVAAHDL